MKALSSAELHSLLTDFASFAPEGPTLAQQSKSDSTASNPSQPQRPVRIALRDLEDALSYIPSDVPRGIGSIIAPDSTPVEDYWFGTILAIRREFGTEGEVVARKWSEASTRYSAEGFDRAWEAFDPAHEKPVGIGSVLALAKAKGWPGHHVGPAPRIAIPERFKRLDRAAIMAIPPMKWRVKGLYPTTGLGAMFGPSGSGKSFLVMDLAINTAMGRVWFGCRTLPCDVTYVMLEGEAGLQGRIVAWERHNTTNIPDNLQVIAQPFEIANEEDVEDLAASLPKRGMLIIDTLNRAAPGLDENSSKDMGILLKGMKRLQEVSGGLVIVVHHTGKEASKGMRGHSSLNAALDGAIEVTRNGPQRTWSASKVKDGRDGGVTAFKLHDIPIGKDSDGDLVGSCAVGFDAEAVPQSKPPSGSAQQAAFALINRTLSQSTELDQAGARGPCMRVDKAIEVVAESLTTVDKNKRRNRARTIVQGLVDRNHLQTGKDSEEECWLWK